MIFFLQPLIFLLQKFNRIFYKKVNFGESINHILMKIMHEQLNLQRSSITVKWDDFPHFTFPWHFHPEYELVYIVRSFGKRFVGDHVNDFSEGDLVLLGSNLPHFWKNDELFHQGNNDYWVNAVVIHFPADFFRHSVEAYSEFDSIKKLISRAKRGISFNADVSMRLSGMLKKILELEGLKRTLLFIEVLDKLASVSDYQLLASESYKNEMQDWSSGRLEKTMHLINSNYKHNPKLETIADHIGMNPSAFSRYFKEKTGKSFIRFITEMKVGYACKLLQEGHLNISQACYESGFNNLSNFNRQFKKITTTTPVSYRNRFVHEHTF